MFAYFAVKPMEDGQGSTPVSEPIWNDIVSCIKSIKDEVCMDTEIQQLK